MKLYAITEGGVLATDGRSGEDALVSLAAQWAASGVDFIQIREKHLTSASLERLARRVVAAVKEAGATTAVLINGRADIALASGADGVHLPGDGAINLSELRQLYGECGRTSPIISVACHTIAEVEIARDEGATMALFAPVFEKRIQTERGAGESVAVQQFGDKQVADTATLSGVGLERLRQACRAAGSMPVFALGGVTVKNAAACLEAGAAGVAAIRLFQSAEWKTLRGC